MIRNEYEQAQQEFRAAYQKATTEDERRKADESRPTAEKYVARMMELAESAPDDPGAVDALVWVVDIRRADQGSRPGHRASRPRPRAGSQDRAGHRPAGPSHVAGRRAPAARYRREEPRSRRARAGHSWPSPGC